MWARNTIPWSLQCDLAGSTREKFWNTIVGAQHGGPNFLLLRSLIFGFLIITTGFFVIMTLSHLLTQRYAYFGTIEKAIQAMFVSFMIL